ncbi:MAG: Uma2 family endonuclease [Isosphaeraceae bacterium]
MTTLITTPGLPPALPGLLPYRLSVDQYEAMIDAGILAETNRLELIEGLIVEKDVKKPVHSGAGEGARRVIERALPAGWHTRGEQPIRIPNRDSEPEPDISVARGTVHDYLDHHPGPPDIALVVEAARTSIAADRALAPTYAGGGIPVYWILNIVDRQLEIYLGPGEKGYVIQMTLLEMESVDLLIEDRVVARIPVADLLPPRPQDAH